MADFIKLKAIEDALWLTHRKRAVALAMLKEAEEENLTLLSDLGAELGWSLSDTAEFLNTIDPKKELTGWQK